MKVKIFRFLGQEDCFLGSGTTVFYCKPLPFYFFSYICCVVNYYFIIYFQRVLLSVLLTALDRLISKSALFLNDLQFIFGLVNSFLHDCNQFVLKPIES